MPRSRNISSTLYINLACPSILTAKKPSSRPFIGKQNLLGDHAEACIASVDEARVFPLLQFAKHRPYSAAALT